MLYDVAMKPEVEHIIHTIRTAMRLLGYTNRDVERKLGLSSSYLSRLFSGGMELRVEHVVDIARAIGLEPEEILQLSYPQPHQPPTEAMQRIQATLHGMRSERPAAAAAPVPPAPAPSPALDSETIQEMMEETLRRFFGELASGGRARK